MSGIVIFGCPQMTCEETLTIAERFVNKRVKIPTWFCLAPDELTLFKAHYLYGKTLDAGITVSQDCPLAAFSMRLSRKRIITPSGKMLYYMKEVNYGTEDDCLRACGVSNQDIQGKTHRERKGFRTCPNNEDTYELHGFIHEAKDILMPFWRSLVQDNRHDLYNKNIKGSVFVYPATIGSTYTGMILLELMNQGVGPAAIIVQNVDPLDGRRTYSCRCLVR